MYSEKVGLAIGLSLVSAYSVYVLFNGLAPFGDEGSACVIAEGILDGRLPYRDLFNEKAPRFILGINKRVVILNN